MVLKAALHIADIANPTKPLDICVYWARKITQEFYEQGDKERARGLTVSPLMDRKTSKIADGQKGFIKFIVRPIFELWAKIVPESKIALFHMANNLAYWENYLDESNVEEHKEGNERTGKFDVNSGTQNDNVLFDISSKAENIMEKIT